MTQNIGVVITSAQDSDVSTAKVTIGINKYSTTLHKKGVDAPYCPCEKQQNTRVPCVHTMAHHALARLPRHCLSSPWDRTDKWCSQLSGEFELPSAMSTFPIAQNDPLS